MTTNDLLKEIATAFAAHCPERIVTREWKDRERYNKAERNTGIHTILYRGEHDHENPYQQYVKLLVYGIIRLGIDDKGENIEQAEFSMIEQLKSFTQSGDIGALLHIKNIVTSHQVEAPEGWYMAECEYGPVDLSVHPNRWNDGKQFDGNMYIRQSPGNGFAHTDDYAVVEDD